MRGCGRGSSGSTAARSRHLIAGGATLAAVLALAIVPIGRAAADTAPTTLYVAPGGQDGSNSCAVATSPCLTIGHALVEAAAGDTISVAKGHYVESWLSVRVPISIIGTAPASTVIDAAHQGGVFVVHRGAGLTLSRVTVENGSSHNLHAGGISNTGSLTLSQDRFVANASTETAGAVANRGSITSITTTRFMRNSTSLSGGAIYNFGSVGPVTEDLFSGNTAVDGPGAIDNEEDMTSIDDDTFVANTSQAEAGAVTTANSLGELSGDTFSDNVSYGGLGGGFENVLGNVGSITDDTFVGNQATAGYGQGGAMVLGTGTVGLLADDTIVDNAAVTGGGIEVEDGTITSIEGVVLADNTATTGPDCALDTSFGGGITDGGHNLVGSLAGGCPFGGSHQDVIGVDPDLEPLGPYAGLTETEPPAPGSPVIDAGGPAPCPTATDQSGTPRPQGPACDIGAVEYVAHPTAHRTIDRGDRR
jgi:predicted outer membrane repeat protein